MEYKHIFLKGVGVEIYINIFLHNNTIKYNKSKYIVKNDKKGLF